MKYLVIASFVAIIASLGMALVFMMRAGHQDEADGTQDTGSPSGRRMARALALRVGFSVLLFVLVLISYWMGWIQPSGLPAKP